MGTDPVSKHSGVLLCRNIAGADLLPGHCLKLLSMAAVSFVWDTQSFSKLFADIWYFKLSGKLFLSLSRG